MDSLTNPFAALSLIDTWLAHCRIVIPIIACPLGSFIKHPWR
jgi:hypothetical protein